MSVAQHLGIKLSEYDHCIRTFIPYYREMLDMVAETVLVTCGKAPRITDLGIGTGGLAARCLAAMPGATIHGVDSDPAILAAAKRRLGRQAGQVQLVHQDFSRAAIPPSDAIVATLALHHIRTVAAKRRFYARCYAALRPGGVLVSGDVFLANDSPLREHDMDTWRKHMRLSYSARQTRAFLEAWAHEDRYLTTGQELQLLGDVGFHSEILWRRPPYGIVLGRRRRST